MDDGDKQIFYVENVEDGRRFKMVIRGDLRKLSVTKIRRYLAASGLSDQHSLSYRGVPLTNEMVGRDFELTPDAVLEMRLAPTATPPPTNGSRNSNTKNNSMGQEALTTHPTASRRVLPPSAVTRGGRWEETDEQEDEEEDQRRMLQQETALPGSRRAPRPSNAGGEPPDLEDEEDYEPAFRCLPTSRTTRHPSSPPASPSSHAEQPARSNGSGVPFQTSAVNRSSGTAQRVEEENRQLRLELEQLRVQVARQKAQKSSPGRGSSAATARAEVLRIARRNLQVLRPDVDFVEVTAELLHCDLRVTPQTVLELVLDLPAERLVLTAEVSHALPSDKATREKLYELLLQGALLGNAVAGGTLGIELDPGRVVLRTTVWMKYAADDALACTVPPFVSALRQWKSLLKELYAA